MNEITITWATKSGFEQKALELENGIATESLDDFKHTSENHVGTSNSQTCIKKNIVSFGGWPETKTEMVMRCTPPPIRICTDVPQVFRRTCNFKLYAEACFPDDVKDDVEECLAAAVIAAALAFAAGGGIAGAKLAFIESFEACIISKLGQRAKEVSFKLDKDTECGRWIPI